MGPRESKKESFSNGSLPSKWYLNPYTYVFVPLDMSPKPATLSPPIRESLFVSSFKWSAILFYPIKQPFLIFKLPYLIVPPPPYPDHIHRLRLLGEKLPFFFSKTCQFLAYLMSIAYRT